MLVTLRKYAELKGLKIGTVRGAVKTGRLHPQKNEKGIYLIDDNTEWVSRRRSLDDEYNGISYSRIYNIWRGMKYRCSNPKFRQYKDYGGRGISVCDEWKKSSLAFYKWSMANGYQDDLQIDRIDNDGNYEPSNCRWVTAKVNAQNKGERRIEPKHEIVNDIVDEEELFLIDPITGQISNNTADYYDLRTHSYVWIIQ